MPFPNELKNEMKEALVQEQVEALQQAMVLEHETHFYAKEAKREGKEAKELAAAEEAWAKATTLRNKLRESSMESYVTLTSILMQIYSMWEATGLAINKSVFPGNRRLEAVWHGAKKAYQYVAEASSHQIKDNQIRAVEAKNARLAQYGNDDAAELAQAKAEFERNFNASALPTCTMKMGYKNDELDLDDPECLSVFVPLLKKDVNKPHLTHEFHDWLHRQGCVFNPEAKKVMRNGAELTALEFDELARDPQHGFIQHMDDLGLKCEFGSPPHAPAPQAFNP